MPIRRPAGDPLDVLNLAAASLRLIGGILLLVAAFAVLWFAIEFSIDDFFGSEKPYLRLARLVPYIFGGGAFLILAFFVKRRHLWAAIVSIVLSALVTLISLILLGALFVMMQAPQFASPWMGVPILLVASFTFAVGQVTFHLTKTPEAMRYLDPNQRGGFETVPPPPLRASPLPPPPLADQHQTS